MDSYLALMKKIYTEGVDKEGRNGFTRSLFTHQLRFDLSQGFPAVTTKVLMFNAVVVELLFFISGERDNTLLTNLKCTIWNANAEAEYWKPKAEFEGDLGRVYGVQWRHWRNASGKETDQLKNLVTTLKTDPNNRRMIVTAWNPGELDVMALPPCHTLFQVYVADGKLSLHMFQRSCDYFLGVPFNIATYALLAHLLARIADLEVGEVILTLGDVHIYHAHFDAVEEQLKRKPYPLPTLYVDPSITSLEDLDIHNFKTPEDVRAAIRLENYQRHPVIKAPIIV